MNEREPERIIQGVTRLIAEVDFELETTLKDISVLFLSTEIAYLGFCLRPKSNISDHWLSHRVKERTAYVILKWSGKNILPDKRKFPSLELEISQ